MSEIRRYIVQQIREVKVQADSPVRAALVADNEFKGLVHDDFLGRVTSEIREVDLLVRENR